MWERSDVKLKRREFVHTPMVDSPWMAMLAGKFKDQDVLLKRRFHGRDNNKKQEE
jgi:hypothetical protein